MIDAHCHLSFKTFNRDREEVIERSREGLQAVVDSGATPATIERSLELSRTHEGFVYSSLGLHPRVGPPYEGIFRKIEGSLDRIVALGEAGLDYRLARDPGEREAQQRLFQRFIALARESGLPLVVHARKAERKAFELLQEGGVKRALFHCYGGDRNLALEILGAGYHLSFATNLCYSRRHQELLASLPREGILLETDAPFLSPRKDAKRNEPLFLHESLEVLSRLWNLPSGEVEARIDRNARKFFSL
jgi:TatD DNase family protein